MFDINGYLMHNQSLNKKEEKGKKRGSAHNKIRADNSIHTHLSKLQNNY